MLSTFILFIVIFALIIGIGFLWDQNTRQKDKKFEIPENMKGYFKLPSRISEKDKEKWKGEIKEIIKNNNNVPKPTEETSEIEKTVVTECKINQQWDSDKEMCVTKCENNICQVPLSCYSEKEEKENCEKDWANYESDMKEYNSCVLDLDTIECKKKCNLQNIENYNIDFCIEECQKKCKTKPKLPEQVSLKECGNKLNTCLKINTPYNNCINKKCKYSDNCAINKKTLKCENVSSLGCKNIALSNCNKHNECTLDLKNNTCTDDDNYIPPVKCSTLTDAETCKLNDCIFIDNKCIKKPLCSDIENEESCAKYNYCNFKKEPQCECTVLKEKNCSCTVRKNGYCIEGHDRDCLDAGQGICNINSETIQGDFKSGKCLKSCYNCDIKNFDNVKSLKNTSSQKECNDLKLLCNKTAQKITKNCLSDDKLTQDTCLTKEICDDKYEECLKKNTGYDKCKKGILSGKCNNLGGDYTDGFCINANL